MGKSNTNNVSKTKTETRTEAQPQNITIVMPEGWTKDGDGFEGDEGENTKDDD